MFVWPTKKYLYLIVVCSTNMNNLLKHIRTLLNSAELVYNAKDYTSSTILLFKALFAILDLLIPLNEEESMATTTVVAVIIIEIATRSSIRVKPDSLDFFIIFIIKKAY